MKMQTEKKQILLKLTKMKANILKLTTILLILTVFCSCAKNSETADESMEKAIEEVIQEVMMIEYGKHLEYTDDSFPDFPWLKEITDGHRKGIEAGRLSHIRIYQCTYKDGTGFLMEECVGCPDAGFGLVDVEGKFLCSEGGWVGSCRDFSVDYENRKLIWEIQPNPPVTIENLYEQPLTVITKSIQGKWKLHKFWDGMSHYYDYTTFVYISESSVAITGNEGINLAFSFSWKKMEVSPPYPDMTSYTTYVMWNDKQKREEWSFFGLVSDMLEVNLYNSGVYTLIRVREDVAFKK
jgi:hypothetical protein